MSSIHPLALVMAASRASRLSGFIAFGVGRMNNALHGREAWRGPATYFNSVLQSTMRSN
jgi:hypothetical protein